VIDGLNPLEARVTDFRNNATNTTVSMLSQFGGRFDGAIAMNSDPANLNALGLISAYETVLNRGRQFSIDAVPPQNYGPTNDALLNISSRLATFYQAIGNEAYADAVDPTIGFSTKSAEYGNMAPSVFLPSRTSWIPCWKRNWHSCAAVTTRRVPPEICLITTG